ncbi:MAG: hypothetical protein Ta2B_07510 [Termitinemataceae bacterium]|nr:MAG: hypothetical protein Ta2B_07510 [Termitinemataceae bacterium]
MKFGENNEQSAAKEMITRIIFSFLAIALSAYSFLIFLRIMLSWFSNSSHTNGNFYRSICRITDPFLYFFDHFKILKIAGINFAPVVALSVLTILINLFFGLSTTGHYTIGMFIYSVINVLSSAIFFIIVFFILILMARLLGYLFRASLYNTFWQVIEMISKPIMQKINSIFFRHRITRWLTSLIVSICSLAVLYAVLKLAVYFIGKLLLG